MDIGRGVLFVLFFFCFISCQERLDESFPDLDPKPVVNSIIRAGENIDVYVSLSAKIDTMPLKSMEEAVVQLYVNDHYETELHYTDAGFYSCLKKGEQGNKYTIVVKIPGFSDIRANTYLPYSETIRSVEHIDIAGRNEDGVPCPAVKVSFTNTPNQKRYFQIVINAINESHAYGSSDYKYFLQKLTSINHLDPILLSEGTGLSVFTNKLIKDTSYTMYLEYTTGEYTEKHNTGGMEMRVYPILVELRSIDSCYYAFLKSEYFYYRLYNNGIGEIYPPCPLFSNIQDGYGIVGAYSSYFSDTIYPKSYKKS